MHTKKEIFKWWESLGNKIEHIKDLNDFYNNIDLKVTFSEELKKDNIRKIVVFSNSKRWKYPLKLYFDKQECFRIVGY